MCTLGPRGATTVEQVVHGFYTLWFKVGLLGG